MKELSDVISFILQVIRGDVKQEHSEDGAQRDSSVDWKGAGLGIFDSHRHSFIR